MPKDPSIVVARRPLVDLGELADVEVRGPKCFYVVRLSNGETRTVDAARFTLRRAFDVAAAPDQAADVPEGFTGRGTEVPSASIATDAGKRRSAASPRSATATPPGPAGTASPTAETSSPATGVPSAARARVPDDASETRTWRRWIEPDTAPPSPASTSASNGPAGCAMPDRSADVVSRDGRKLGPLVKVEAADGRCLYWIRRHDDAMWVVDASTVRLTR